MPGFDGTGPRGMGPMTGGGRGFCSPWGIGSAFGGYGASPRMGYGYPYYGAWPASPVAMPFPPQITREQELDFLRNQSEMMRKQMEQIETRMRELEPETES